jgi:hypothetical protein
VRKKQASFFEKFSIWFSFWLILGLVGYCVYFKLQFWYLIILLVLFILLPFVSNITEFSLASLLRIKIGKEVEKLLPDFVKAYKELFQREFVSNISDNSIKLTYMPDPTTIEITFGHDIVIPCKEPQSFDVAGKTIKIKYGAILKSIEFFVNQPPGKRPIVKYLRKINNTEKD